MMSADKCSDALVEMDIFTVSDPDPDRSVRLEVYLCFMKFQVGDKVLILHSNEEGEIIDIINNKMVMVDVRGVRFPAYIDQLDFPYFKKFSENKLFPKK